MVDALIGQRILSIILFIINPIPVYYLDQIPYYCCQGLILESKSALCVRFTLYFARGSSEPDIADTKQARKYTESRLWFWKGFVFCKVHRMKLCHLVNWMFTERSGKVPESHSYAIQSSFTYHLVTFMLTVFHSCILWFLSDRYWISWSLLLLNKILSHAKK